MNLESGSEPIGFQVRSTPLLRGHGLRGEPIMVELAGSDLLLRGAEGGCLCIAAASAEVQSLPGKPKHRNL